MKRREEPAEKLLTMQPAEETSLSEEGFLSALYVPESDAYPGKVMILCGGSDGYFSLTKLIAEQYAGRGLTVLALAYWNQKGLPEELYHVPLEYGEKAAQWLKNRGYEKIAMAGVSMGAEYSLLCGCSFPDLITCVVGISPISVVTQGLRKKTDRYKKMKLLDGSAFCLRGEELPWVPLRFDKKQMLKDCIKRKELTTLSCYRDVVEKSREEGQIPAEKILGPLLLLAADQDSMWPSALSAEKIIRRREEKGLETQYEHYAYASHMLIPCKLKSRKIYRMERQFPEKCWQSDLDAFQKTLVFLKTRW